MTVVGKVTAEGLFFDAINQYLSKGIMGNRDLGMLRNLDFYQKKRRGILLYSYLHE